jgi:hypothetical protein
MPTQIVSWSFKDTTDGLLVANSLPSEHLAESLADLLEHLTTEVEHSMNILWDIDEDITPVLRLLGEPACRTLSEKGEVTIRPYRVSYTPGHLFSIMDFDSGFLTEFYCLKQFLPEYPEPDDINQLYLWGRMAHKVIGEIGLNPTRLYSIGNIFANGVLKTLNIPTWRDLPEKVAEYALYCSKRQWIEALQIGHWEQATDLDLTAAYPSRMINLVDHRFCAWKQWRPETRIPDNAIYGYFKCHFNIRKDVSLHPVITYVYEEPMSCTGEFIDYINLATLKWFQENSKRLGSMEILDGAYCVPNRPDFAEYRMTYPLLQIIPRLLSKRTKFEPIRDMIAKVGINSLGGYLSMVTTKDGQDAMGDWCNPVWATEFTTATRLEVVNFIYRNHLEPNVLHISVDGVLCDKEHALTAIDSAAGWRSSYTGPALILSTGRIFLGKRHPGGLTYHDAVSMVRSDPGNCAWHATETRRMTLAEAVTANAIDKLGTPIETTQSLHLFPSHRRYFKKTPSTGTDLLSNHYTSVPFHVKVEKPVKEAASRAK